MIISAAIFSFRVSNISLVHVHERGGGGCSGMQFSSKKEGGGGGGSNHFRRTINLFSTRGTYLLDVAAPMHQKLSEGHLK